MPAASHAGRAVWQSGLVATVTVPAAALEAIRAELAAAGVRGLLCVRDLATGAEVCLDADTPVVLASVFKVPVATEFARQVGAGELDPAERIRVPADRRTSGPTGISVLRDEVEMSLRDLAQLMISVSDNTATDVVLAQLGCDAVNANLMRLGLEQTVLEGDCAFLLERLFGDLALSDDEATRLEQGDEAVFDGIDAARWARCRDLDAQQTNRSTPREMVRLLELIWTDQAATPEQCAFVRRIMGQQVWPHRLRSGFSGGARTSGKTGTLPFIRNEVGVVEYPDGARYAAAVFTMAARAAMHQPAADHVIGTVARMAIDALRGEAASAVSPPANR